LEHEELSPSFGGARHRGKGVKREKNRNRGFCGGLSHKEERWRLKKKTGEWVLQNVEKEKRSG